MDLTRSRGMAVEECVGHSPFHTSDKAQKRGSLVGMPLFCYDQARRGIQQHVCAIMLHSSPVLVLFGPKIDTIWTV